MDMHNLLLSVGGFPLASGDSSWGTIIFLYLGPETTLPLASALAAIIGVLLIFWRRVLVIASKAFRFVRQKVVSLFAKDESLAAQGSDSDGDTLS